MGCALTMHIGAQVISDSRIMLTFCVREMEMTSLSQKRKIEELEAQLQEAEDIVRSLREKLATVWDELKDLKRNQSQAEHNIKHCAATEEGTSEQILNTSAFIACTLPNFPLEPPRSLADQSLKLHDSTQEETSDMKDLTLHLRSDRNKCHRTRYSHLENQYVGNADLTTVIMRTKEPELYRNGCSQRVRSFERNMLDSNCALSTQVNCVTKESIVSEDTKIEGMNVSSTLKADNCCGLENPDKINEVILVNKSSYRTYATKSFRRKRTVRYRKAQSSQHPCSQVMSLCEASDLSFPQVSLFPVDNNVQYGESSSNASENEAGNDMESSLPSRFPPETTEMKTDLGCLEISHGNLEFVKVSSIQRTLNSDKPIMDNLLGIKENGSAKTSRTSISKMNLEIDSLPSNPDVNASNGMSTGVSCQPVSDRIRYTFQRKRKKESLARPNESPSLKKSSSERKIKQTENDPEP